MIDPKQKLTRFSQIYSAKERDIIAGPTLAAAGTVGFRDTTAADLFAKSGVIHETDANTLSAMQALYSISSVEELVALARIDDRQKTENLKNLGISRGFVEELQKTLSQSPLAEDEFNEWERLEQFEYSSGFEIDLTAPPPDVDANLAAAALGAAPPGGTTAIAAPLASAPTVNLIDNFMSPIRDQGNRGTCVAFATMACLEYHHHRFSAMASLDLSEQFAYWNMVTKKGQQTLVALFSLLTADGSCPELTWVYYGNEIPGNPTQGPPPPSAVTQAKAYCPKQVVQLPARSVDAIKQALNQKRVVAIGIPVYNSWFNSAIVRQFGNITVPIPGEVPQPVGHAIALVGYEDNPEHAGGGYFIVRNSWDSYWAPQSVFGPGYGTIPYRYIGSFNWDAWCIVS